MRLILIIAELLDVKARKGKSEACQGIPQEGKDLLSEKIEKDF
jgi:hypothetical protein